MSVAIKSTREVRPSANGWTPLLFHRFTVEQYQRMIDTGVLTENDRVELLEGWIVEKMTQKPRHAVTLDQTQEMLRRLVSSDWFVREQKPIITDENGQPEPDIALVRGPIRRYRQRHPGPGDLAAVIEVADSSLEEDREVKGPIYARAGIPVYWIVNIPDAKIEVYTQPKVGKTPGYRRRRDYGMNESVPLVIEGQEVAQIAVRDLLP